MNRQNKENSALCSKNTNRYKSILSCNSDMSFLRLYDPERAAYDHTKDRAWRILFVNCFLGRFMTSNANLANACGVSLNIASSWSSFLPHRRENIIAISCFFGIKPFSNQDNELSCSELLKNFGFEPLDPGNPEDIIFISLLNHTQRDSQDYGNPEKQSAYPVFLQRYRMFAKIINKEKLDISVTSVFNYDQDAIFCSLYFMTLMNNRKNAAIVRDKITEIFGSVGYKTFKDFCSGSGVPTRISASCECLFDNKFAVLPPRTAFIGLMLCMGMTFDEINTMLETAGLFPLSATDPFESVLVYLLCQFEKEKEKVNPDKKNTEKVSLYTYVRNRLINSVLSEFFNNEELDIDELLPV